MLFVVVLRVFDDRGKFSVLLVWQRSRAQGESYDKFLMFSTGTKKVKIVRVIDRKS
jgi:hypothetical protein